MIRLLLAALVALAYFASPPCFSIEINNAGMVSGGVVQGEEESRFFPGVYFFRKGCDAYAAGKAKDAIELWTRSASWGHKGAQYNLGIAFLKGKGSKMDIPQGLAWLGLAAQSEDPQFQESFDAAWYLATNDDRILAKKRYEDLKPKYGDDVALKRALRRYNEEKRSFTGSRVGAAGNLTIYSAGSAGGRNAATYIAELERKADEYFGSDSGSASVGDLIPLADQSKSATPTD